MSDRRAEERLRIPPYALTGGRVRSSTDLPLEAIVRVTEAGQTNARALPLEQREICRICGNPTSIAEVSAHLQLPLGVVRVLVGDLVTDGLLDSNDSAVPLDNRPDLRLLERVLDGLQAL